jgi:transposase
MGEPAVGQGAGVPDEVLTYARSKVKGEKVIEAWMLHMHGGLSARQCATRLSVSETSAQGWLRDCKRLVAEGKKSKSSRRVPGNVALVTAETLPRKRAELLALAERGGKLDLQAKLLDAEQRRLGLEVQRTENVTLTVQVQAMPQAQRQAEIMERMQRMVARGSMGTDAQALIGVGEGEEAGGTTPPAGPSDPLPSTPSKSPPKNQPDEGAAAEWAARFKEDADEQET